MCKVIAVSNQKGGVGKTVSCVNLGIGLAQEGKNNRSQFDFLIVLFEYVLQALFLCRYRFKHISVLDSGNGEKNGNDNRPENQGMQKK